MQKKKKNRKNNHFHKQYYGWENSMMVFHLIVWTCARIRNVIKREKDVEREKKIKIKIKICDEFFNMKMACVYFFFASFFFYFFFCLLLIEQCLVWCVTWIEMKRNCTHMEPTKGASLDALFSVFFQIPYTIFEYAEQHITIERKKHSSKVL